LAILVLINKTIYIEIIKNELNVKHTKATLKDTGEKEKREIVKGYTDRFRSAGVDGIVLGCTHFLFVKEEFRLEAAPDIQIFDSVNTVTQSAEALLDDNNSALRAADNEKKQGLFLLTGSEEPDSSWKSWADYMNFPISLFNGV